MKEIENYIQEGKEEYKQVISKKLINNNNFQKVSSEDFT